MSALDHVQVDTGFIVAGALELAAELGVDDDRGLVLGVRLWAFLQQRSHLSVNDTVRGPKAPTVIASAVGWKGDPWLLCRAYEKVGLVTITSDSGDSVTSVRIRGGDRYAAAFLKRKRHREAQARYRLKQAGGNTQAAESAGERVMVTGDAGDAHRGEERRGEENYPLPRQEGLFGPADQPTPADSTTVDQLFGLWNACAADGGALPSVRILTPTRRLEAAQRLKETPQLAIWREAMERLRASRFCRGQGERGWKANFDWLLGEGNLAKVLNGGWGTGTDRFEDQVELEAQAVDSADPVEREYGTRLKALGDGGGAYLAKTLRERARAVDLLEGGELVLQVPDAYALDFVQEQVGSLLGKVKWVVQTDVKEGNER